MGQLALTSSLSTAEFRIQYFLVWVVSACPDTNTIHTSLWRSLSHIYYWHFCFSRSGAKLDDFADFTTFGIATSLLLRTSDLLDNILCMCYVLSVFVRLCFFSSGEFQNIVHAVVFFWVCHFTFTSWLTGDLFLFGSLRDPIHVPRPALHLLLSHSGQCLSAVRRKHDHAAGHRNGHDPLYDQSELLPSRQSAGVPGLEESRLRRR